MGSGGGRIRGRCGSVGDGGSRQPQPQRRERWRVGTAPTDEAADGSAAGSAGTGRRGGRRGSGRPSVSLPESAALPRVSFFYLAALSLSSLSFSPPSVYIAHLFSIFSYPTCFFFQVGLLRRTGGRRSAFGLASRWWGPSGVSGVLLPRGTAGCLPGSAAAIVLPAPPPGDRGLCAVPPPVVVPPAVPAASPPAAAVPGLPAPPSGLLSVPPPSSPSLPPSSSRRRRPSPAIRWRPGRRRRRRMRTREVPSVAQGLQPRC